MGPFGWSGSWSLTWIQSGEVNIEADAGTAAICADGIGVAITIVAEGASCALSD